MSGAAASSDVSLVLAVPKGQPSVQHWVGVSANSPDAPGYRARPVYREVIYAEHKPRLSAQELQARQRRAVAGTATAASVEVSCSTGYRKTLKLTAPAAHGSWGVSSRWSVWPALLIVGAVLAVGTPLL